MAPRVPILDALGDKLELDLLVGPESKSLQLVEVRRGEVGALALEEGPLGWLEPETAQRCGKQSARNGEGPTYLRSRCVRARRLPA